MRVVHVAPLWYGISFDGPGGIETLLAALVSAQAAAGAEVALAAVGDSRVDVEVIPTLERPLFDEMRAGRAFDQTVYEQHALIELLPRLDGFDVCHVHAGPGALALTALAHPRCAVLYTVHGQVTTDLEWFAERHPDVWMTTVAEPQAAGLRARGARHCHVVPNGIAFDRFPLGDAPGDGLVFLGRMEPEKGPDIAIEVARATERELVLAGPIVDRPFFEERIEPALGDGVAYAGVVGHDEKCALLGRSACALMPSRWDEPFGLVAVEAMACGTPVVALGNGALPDLVESGVTGWTTGTPEELPRLVAAAASLDRERVRRRAAERFAIERCAEQYLALYEAMAEARG